jgi:hypothetical protein
MNIRCDRCGREPDEVAPMLKDVVWRQIARKNETLCKACAHERIRRRFGRELRFADLLPCAFNITWCSAFEELMPLIRSVPPVARSVSSAISSTARSNSSARRKRPLTQADQFRPVFSRSVHAKRKDGGFRARQELGKHLFSQCVLVAVDCDLSGAETMSSSYGALTRPDV